MEVEEEHSVLVEQLLQGEEHYVGGRRLGWHVELEVHLHEGEDHVEGELHEVEDLQKE